ncbi:hypothetical protein B0H11DRAFT_2240976 [Mycena galericulata]|nr:hypothetical protein B0H11DRAFT_2240976 [Mycena galericulata]
MHLTAPGKDSDAGTICSLYVVSLFARKLWLNGFMEDLASLLPNLAGVRRPSKNAILESSIAYIRSSRNFASQQLLALHAESESLRREANEWRLWAGVPDGLTTWARDDEELDEQYTSFMFPRPSATSANPGCAT